MPGTGKIINFPTFATQKMAIAAASPGKYTTSSQQSIAYVRRTPITLEEGATKLAEQTQLPPETCLTVLKQMFLWGSKTKGLAFCLHQFISQGGSVYTTIENRDERLLTLEGQYTTTENRLLYPLVFCRRRIFSWI